MTSSCTPPGPERPPHRTWRRSTRTLLLGAVLVGAALLGSVAVPAEAHDALRSSSPGDRETVRTVPNTVVLTFDEPAVALGTQLVVTGPTGPVQRGAPRLVGTTVVQDLQPGGAAGEYVVDWRVTSGDGHPVSGSFTFLVSTGSGSATASPTASPTASAPLPARSPSTPGPVLTVAGIVLMLVIAAAAAVVVVRRARRRRR